MVLVVHDNGLINRPRLMVFYALFPRRSCAAALEIRGPEPGVWVLHFRRAQGAGWRGARVPGARVPRGTAAPEGQTHVLPDQLPRASESAAAPCRYAAPAAFDQEISLSTYFLSDVVRRRRSPSLPHRYPSL